MSLDHDLSQTTHDAVASGTSATRFQIDKSPYEAAAGTPTARVNHLARRALAGIRDVIREEKVSYAEYNALKAWLIEVGETGEWPLFLDVWLEHAVEEVATAHRQGSTGSIEGPFYIPGAPEQGANGTIPMRDDEAGIPLHWDGSVTSTDGSQIDAATLEIWHGDSDGAYSQFAPGLPKWNLRGSFTVGPDGRFSIRAIQPGAYQIPTGGACGKLVAAAGWHAWRPAHLHIKVSAEGHETLISQLYFPGDPHNDDDVASAVKPELILDPVATDDGAVHIDYSFVLDPAPS